MRTILVTGGSGFIGQHLVETLLSDGKEVLIVNLDLAKSEFSHPQLKTYICDIRSADSFERIEENEFTCCIHLAALCKEPGYKWDEYFTTNHVGTKNIIRFCLKHNVEEILFTSTMMVYRAGDKQMKEDSATAPDTAYGISKLLAELELRSWLGGTNRRLKIIRPGVVFGENENANFTRLYRSLRRGFFPYVGKSSTIKSSIYVKELINFVKYLLETETKETTYNLTFPEDQSIGKIVSLFKHVFEMKSFNPVLPYTLLVAVSYLFELMNWMGVKNSIHHRRIQKLYRSTDIEPKNALKEGYKFQFDLKNALEHWKKECGSNDIG